MEIRPDVNTQAPPRQAAAPAPQQQEAPPQVQPDFVEITVPMRIPSELVKPDANGQVPLAQYMPKLVPADAIITSEAEVKTLVDTVKKQAAPPGTHPEINPSQAGHKVDVAKQTVMKLANAGGGIATYSLMSGGSGFLAIPMAIAGPLATVGGAIGAIAAFDQTKEALNLKGYYENLKKDGVEVIPIQVPVQTKEGVQVQVREIPTDELIKGARDAAVSGGIQIAGGVLMAAAGIAGAPAVAIAAIAVSAAGALYAAKPQLLLVAKAAWAKIKGMFSKDDENKQAQQPQAPQQVQPPQEMLIAGEAPKPKEG